MAIREEVIQALAAVQTDLTAAEADISTLQADVITAEADIDAAEASIVILQASSRVLLDEASGPDAGLLVWSEDAYLSYDSLFVEVIGIYGTTSPARLRMRFVDNVGAAITTNGYTHFGRGYKINATISWTSTTYPYCNMTDGAGICTALQPIDGYVNLYALGADRYSRYLGKMFGLNAATLEFTTVGGEYNDTVDSPEICSGVYFYVPSGTPNIAGGTLRLWGIPKGS